MERATPPQLVAPGARVLVTGASGGIGRAVVDAFARQGAEAIGADLEGPLVERLDVCDEHAVNALFERHGPFDHVIHAAGVASLGGAADTTVDEFRRVVEINLTGSFVVARVAAAHLREGSTLVLISSQAGRRGAAGWIAYCSSKFGVIGLAESLAQELAPRGIRVNVLCPGSIDTGMTPAILQARAHAEHTTSEAIRDGYLAGIPLGRLGTADEVAGACMLLASPLASFIAGASLVVDGGELS